MIVQFRISGNTYWSNYTWFSLLFVTSSPQPKSNGWLTISIALKWFHFGSEYNY